jgi:hypothetical protein
VITDKRNAPTIKKMMAARRRREGRTREYMVCGMEHVVWDRLPVVKMERNASSVSDMPREALPNM